MEHFGNRINQARQLRGLSQKDLARMCGISQSAISSYERGERASSKRILVIAKALNVNPYWLDSGKGEILLHDYTLRESATTWPFTSIKPNRFWSLSNKDRAIIEATVSVLIENLSKD